MICSIASVNSKRVAAWKLVRVSVTRWLSHLHQSTLGWEERVVENADHRVRSREVRARARRSSPELFLVQSDKGGRDVLQDGPPPFVGA
jgi:hypothetical protein